jgi:hypothetical protein
MAKRDLLTINEDNLDKEWINQPTLFYDEAVALAAARYQLDEAKSALEVLKADTAIAVRTNPEKYGIAKITEASVDAAVLLDLAVKSQTEELNQAKYSVEIRSAMVKAMEQRRDALEALVKLHGQSYFSSPKATGKEKDGIDEVTKKKQRKAGQYRPEGRE